MEGYDLGVGGGASLYEYRKVSELWSIRSEALTSQYFGSYVKEIDDYQLSAGWQGALSQAGNIGNVLGIAIGTFTIDKWGYRKTLLANYAIIMPFIGESGLDQAQGLRAAD